MRLIGGPPTVAALIADQIDAAAVLVTLEGMNANIKKPGAAIYISLNSQSQTYPMEQFVVREGFKAKSLKDLKGARTLSAPGPGNVLMAKAALEASGLKVLKASIARATRYRAASRRLEGRRRSMLGYTLEPNATVMRKQGVATTLEAGVIALRARRSEGRCSWAVASCRAASSTSGPMSPAVTRPRGSRPSGTSRRIPRARAAPLKNTLTPEDVVGEVPMLGYFTVAQLTDAHRKQFQKFIDFSMKLINAPETIEAGTFLKVYWRTCTRWSARLPSPVRPARTSSRHGPRPPQVFRGLAAVQQLRPRHPEGRIVSVFGPNGCGKSTLINMIAGLIPIDAGEILFDGKSLKDTKIGYVFQNYREALFPWLRTIDNIAYPLKSRRPQVEGRGRPPGRASWSPPSRSSSTCSAIPTSCPAASSRRRRSCAR